ncbi:MAG: S41 family peptidase [Planctomycetota bacterium]
MHTSVRSELRAGAQTLPEFLGSIGNLSSNHKRTLIQQALILIEDNYVHLPLKAAMHAVEPIQQLKLLEHRLDQFENDFLFHREMTKIFSALRDLHTNYLLPSPFNEMRAFLPFAVERSFSNGQEQYIVAHLANGFTHAKFKPGVEILKWSGVPISRAIEIVADQNAGSNPDARRARGIERLTFRPLIISLPPDEEWVEVEYKTESGAIQHERFEWTVIPQIESDQGDVSVTNSRALGVDIEMEQIQKLKKQLLAPKVLAEEKKAKARRASASRSKRSMTRTASRRSKAGNLTSNLPGRVEAKVLETSAHGAVGYIRIRTFNIEPDELIDEMVRLLELVPENGLIIDVRGNGGGIIMSGERLLQLLTPHPIQPEPTQFITSQLNLKLCQRHVFLSEWVPSLERAIETGARFSQGFPISPPEECNDIGQVYSGPTVLITDARCYSTTDIFAAGFQDHEIGPILGVDANTGAGGANVWQHDLLHRLFPGTTEGSPYKTLPRDAGMRVSIRRTLRVHKNAGTPVEDLGVVPDHLHQMTRADVLNENVDLIEHAASLLADIERHTLTVSKVEINGDGLTIKANTLGIERLDFYLNDRPSHSEDVVDGSITIELDEGGDADELLIQGFSNDKLVASHKRSL